ncbi:alpha/beta-hydrolase [Thozetella sp. PMI_491]|nr:alpha/beta-hydrolase [Thozetella sp. PMI_491]
MYVASIIGFISFVTVALARDCWDINIPVKIASQNGVFALKAPHSNIDVANFILNLAQVDSTYVSRISKGYQTVSGTYTIAATYCQPNSGPGKTIQVLTHGIAFDRRYWDLSYNNYNYSYVSRAVARGYSTLFYDRLGLGLSSRGDPVSEIQSFLEVASLEYLTKLLREGKVPRIRHKFDKIVHVGHSFGSIQSYGLAAAQPNITDGIVLTGFSMSSSFIPFFAYGGNFVLARTQSALSSYPDGYLAGGDPTGAQLNFFAPGQFDPDILPEAVAVGQPVTAGELLTVTGPLVPENAFAGPVLVITGERDIPFCGGNCSTSVPSLPAKVQENFPNAAKFEAVVVPDAGHGLNLEYSHSDTYGTILDFLDKYI